MMDLEEYDRDKIRRAEKYKESDKSKNAPRIINPITRIGYKGEGAEMPDYFLNNLIEKLENIIYYDSTTNTYDYYNFIREHINDIELIDYIKNDMRFMLRSKLVAEAITKRDFTMYEFFIPTFSDASFYINFRIQDAFRELLQHKDFNTCDAFNNFAKNYFKNEEERKNKNQSEFLINKLDSTYKNLQYYIKEKDQESFNNILELYSDKKINILKNYATDEYNYDFVDYINNYMLSKDNDML